jgi:O-antigen/teichoic acid export membrane protein
LSKSIIGLGADTLVYGVGSALTRAIGLLLLPFFTHFVSPSDFGVLAMLGILGMVLQPVFGLGVSASLGPVYYNCVDEQAKGAAVWTGFSISALSSLVLVLVAWAMPRELCNLIHLPLENAHLISLSLTGIALGIMSIPLSLQAQFERRARLYVGINVASVIVTMFVTAVSVGRLKMGASGMVMGQLAGNAASFLAFAVWALARPWLYGVSWRYAKEILAIGIPLIPSFAFLFVIMYLNRYILEWVRGLSEVGVYSVGFSLGMGICVVTSAVASAWYPYFMQYKDRQKEAEVVFGKVFLYVMLGIGSLCLAFAFAGRPAVILLTPNAFHGASLVVGLIALANLLQILFNLLLPGIYFNDNVRWLSIIQGAAAAISLPVNYLMIDAWGGLGAAAGVVAGNLLMLLALVAWNYRSRNHYLAPIYDWERMFKFCGMAIFLLMVWLATPVWSFFIELGKAVLLMLALVIFLWNLLNAYEKEALRKLLPQRRSGSYE